MKPTAFLPLLVLCAGIHLVRAADATMPRLAHNNPGTLADLGVGLWAWPLPMDYNSDGLMDLVVVCTDKPYNGTWYFENSGQVDSQLKLPIFKPAVLVGKSAPSVGIYFADVVVPRGATQLAAGDKIILMGTPEAMREVEKIVRPGGNRGRQRVTIIGGGDVGLEVAELGPEAAEKAMQ